jgi:hypothetical protein
MVPVMQQPTPQINLLPKQPPQSANQKKGGVDGIMSNFLGGAEPDDHMLEGGAGLLDHQQPNGRPSEMAGSTTQKPSSMNQDLWLLMLFFKGCALLV